MYMFNDEHSSIAYDMRNSPTRLNTEFSMYNNQDELVLYKRALGTHNASMEEVKEDPSEIYSHEYRVQNS